MFNKKKKSGKKEVLIRRLKNYHKQTNLNNPNYKLDKTFDYVCVIDYEATCSEAIGEYPVINNNSQLFYLKIKAFIFILSTKLLNSQLF